MKINSEKKDKIIPFLKDIKARYGIPLAVVSDMGKGLLMAIEEVFPGILSLIVISIFCGILEKTFLMMFIEIFVIV